MIVHPEYDIERFKNDIALVKLAEPLELDGKTVSSLSLPSHLATFTGEGTTSCFSQYLNIFFLLWLIDKIYFGVSTK